jgi:hypothetical protein
MDKFGRKVFVNLLSQKVDIDLNRVGLGVKVNVPDVVRNGLF